MNKLLPCACGMILSSFALAQSVAIPDSGIIFDTQSHSLRSIDGIAGSATLGPSLAAANITLAAVCSPRRFALIARGGDTPAVSIFNLGKSPAVSLPAAVLNAPDQAVLSASCSAALLFSSSSSQVQLIAGLPGAPVITASFSLPLTGVSSFALSDDGSTVLCVVPGDAVYVLSPSLPPRPLLPLAGDGGVVFQNSRDALIADSAGNRIVTVSNVLFSPAPQVLAGQDAGISSPTSVAYSTSKQQIFIGNTGNSAIALLSSADNAVSFFPCGCQGSFSSLGNGVYQVSAPVNGLPLLVLDADSLPPKVLFVPARQ